MKRVAIIGTGSLLERIEHALSDVEGCEVVMIHPPSLPELPIMVKPSQKRPATNPNEISSKAPARARGRWT